MIFKKSTEKGISLRVIHLCLIGIAVVMSIVMLYSTVRLSSNFRHVIDATEEHMALERSALELMDASDYLTECVQRFTINGDTHFMEMYFTETFDSQRREEAVRRMQVDADATPALEMLQSAMDGSVRLMEDEYYAMRLVIEAKRYTDYPGVLKEVELSSSDVGLPPSVKMRRATEIVLGDRYYTQKDQIRTDVHACLEEIEKLTSSVDNTELTALQRELNVVRVIIVLLIATILFMVWLTAYLGIDPVLQAVDRIKTDRPIPEVGANEFRYLAQAYNKMYTVYKTSIDRLNFKASHDELTGVYNRAGYDLLLSSIDMDTTYMILIDVDNFKAINDNYGHEVGDKALIRLAEVLRSSFRADDHICRIGGDEFVAFMVHSTEMQHALIESKIERINSELEKPKDGLPPISISVGIVHGSQAADAATLFEESDEAMYEAKRHGKHGYTFYTVKG